MEHRAVVGPKVCGRDLYISDKPEGFVPGKLQRGWVVFINWCAISSCCREKPSLFFLSAVASTPNPPLGFSPQHSCPITRMWPTGSVCCFSVPVLELFKVAKTNHPNHFSRVRSADHRDPGGWLSGPTILMLGFPAPWSRGHVGDSSLSRSSGTVTHRRIDSGHVPTRQITYSSFKTFCFPW